MPYRPKTPCKHNGCPNLSTDSYCNEHKPMYQRASSSKRGYGSKWQSIRKRYLKEHPLCTKCNGSPVEATEVHHILALREGGTNADSNLQSLCKSCHSKITKKHQDGYSY